MISALLLPLLRSFKDLFNDSNNHFLTSRLNVAEKFCNTSKRFSNANMNNDDNDNDNNHTNT